MKRREISGLLFAAGSGAVISSQAKAQTAGPVFPITSVEASGVHGQPVNLSVPSHDVAGIVYVDRFGRVNTNGNWAIQAAIDVGLATGCPVSFGRGTYTVTTPLTFGNVTSEMRPIDIGGVGIGTRIINASGPGSPTFSMDGVSGWYLHDMLLTGEQTALNDGIWANHPAPFTGSTRWRIERITSMMPGRGIVCANTNTGVIRDFKHWPDNADTLRSGMANIQDMYKDHGIHLTGGFCHDITIYDADCCPRPSFKANACGIFCDAHGPNHGIRIYGTLAQGTPNAPRTGIYLKQCTGARIDGTYIEWSTIRLNDVNMSVISGIGNGGEGGSLVLEMNCNRNVFQGITVATLDIQGVLQVDNTFIACYVLQSWNDLSKPNNRYINCAIPTSAAAGGATPNGHDRAGDTWVTLPPSNSITPDRSTGRLFNIVRGAGQGSGFTINDPINMIDGEEIIIKIRNATGGSLGPLAWGPFTRAASVLQPANNFSITRTFRKDTSYDSGALLIQVGTDTVVRS